MSTMINEVTLLGHKDHGKSTLIGRMLMDTHSVSKARIDNAKMMSKRLGRKFEPGFLLDSFEEEQEGALTIDTTRAQIKYRGSAFEFIDVPGHEELIKNMISGASNASFALLMVSAKGDEGVEDQTKRHLFLAKMMGIESIIVCVNKMDTVDYSERRFEEIVGGLRPFLSNVGFARNSVIFVPVSAYNSDNISRRSERMGWYRGKPLLDLLVDLSKRRRSSSDKTLRIIFQGVMGAGDDLKYIGRVVSGSLNNGEQIVLMPTGKRVMIERIFVKGRAKQTARSGENVALVLDRHIAGDGRGIVGYGSRHRGARSKSIDALIFAIGRIGVRAKIRSNGVEHQCSIKLVNGIDTTTGGAAAWSGVRELEAGRVVINLNDYICVEPFAKSRELGRFTIHSGKELVGIGIVNG